jgi:uncharacterized protein YkwD
MIITELFEPAPAGYHDEDRDGSVARTTDSRRANRLTLAHINQLRRSNDVKKLEHEKKLQAVAKQYAPAAEAGGGMPLGI